MNIERYCNTLFGRPNNLLTISYNTEIDLRQEWLLKIALSDWNIPPPLYKKEEDAVNEIDIKYQFPVTDFSATMPNGIHVYNSNYTKQDGKVDK